MQRTQATVLPVPNSNCLIIGRRENPRKLMMKEDSSNIIEMAVQCKEASSGLVWPDFNLVIIAARDEERLCFVKIDAADRTIMLLESIYQCAHPVIPELDCGGVKGHKDPWSSTPYQFSEIYRSTWGARSYLFGWNAIPLALDDFDSNWRALVRDRELSSSE